MTLYWAYVLRLHNLNCVLGRPNENVYLNKHIHFYLCKSYSIQHIVGTKCLYKGEFKIIWKTNQSEELGKHLHMGQLPNSPLLLGKNLAGEIKFSQSTLRNSWCSKVIHNSRTLLHCISCIKWPKVAKLCRGELADFWTQG